MNISIDTIILILIAGFFLLSCICFALEPLSPTGIVLIIYCLLFIFVYVGNHDLHKFHQSSEDVSISEGVTVFQRIQFINDYTKF